MILIIGDETDNHVKRVSRSLTRHGADYTVIDPFKTIILPSARIELNPRTDRRNYIAIWDRLKPIALGSLDEKAQYIIRERVAAIRAIQWQNVDSARLMNPPSAAEYARSKFLQLKTAAAHSLQIPRTYIGNDADEACEFVQNCQAGAIAKSLTWYVGPDARMSFTHVVTVHRIRSAAASVAYSPLIYQEYVPKKYELRVTCVGSALFAAKIHSQKSRKAIIDWRRDQFNLRYEKTVLPSDLEEKILGVQSTLGLNYGAYDFAVTPKEEYVFLEVNSSGNWLWLEDRLHLQISEGISKWLLGIIS